MKSFWHNVNSSLYTPWSPGVGRGHNREPTFTCLYLKKKCRSRTSWSILIKLGTNHPWIKDILDYTNKRPGLLQSGDNHKNAKKKWRGNWKSFSLRTTETELLIFLWKVSEIVQIKARTNYGPLEGQGWGHKRGNYFYICILERIF
jgi:hypothetical protein